MLIRLYNRKRIESRFPVSGDYISFYEDIIDGQKVVAPSESRIIQRGASLKITTKDPNERSWTLSGTIMQGGHVSGVYSADAVYDDGVGSFYLKISKDALDGMWNGYDHENKMTNSGRYWFRRFLPASIVPYEKSFLNDILHTSANAFGYGYIDTDAIKNDSCNFALVAIVRGEFAGFCFGRRLPIGSLPDLLKMSPGILPDDVRVSDSSGTLGIMKTIAIRRKYQGHGVGSRLVKAAEESLVKLGCECILVPAWSVEGKTPIENILLTKDYAKWVTNEGYWKASCEAQEFKCISYNGKCRCSVTFFRKGRL